MRMLETSRLILRHFQMQDAEVVWLFSREMAYCKWLPDQVYANKTDAEEGLGFLISQYDRRALPYVLAVEEKESGELIGHVGLSRISQGVEIGDAIGQQYQQKGYATEAIKAFSDWAMQELGYTQLFGVVHSDNRSSQKVLEKAGFTRLAGEITPVDTILYEK